MSVFKVKLNSSTQGTMDVDPTTGLEFTTSIQRTVYVMGPERINVKLADGETFTGNNYWKKFVAVADGGTCVPPEAAFLTIEDDDGSVWNDDTKTSSNFVDGTSITCAAGSTFAENYWDIAGDTGSYAIYTRIKNLGASGSVTVRVNEVASFTLEADQEMIFENNDFPVTYIEINNDDSGAVESIVQILATIKSPSLSVN